MTTTEGASGVGVQPLSAPTVLAGGHGLNVTPGASPEVVRAEARREQQAGSEPSNAPGTSSPRPRAELRRVSVRAHDDSLRCDVVSGIGFSWRCTCGKRGPIVPNRGAAVAGKRAHEAEHAR